MLWDELVREVPSEPNYRINLAVTNSNLGYVLVAQGRIKEAREEINRSSSLVEVLAASPLPQTTRALVDGLRDFLRNTEFGLLLGQGRCALPGAE